MPASPGGLLAMLPQEIIRRKRDGKALTPGHIRQFVKGLADGSFTDGQVGYNRPFAGAGRYRAHVEGLYLCGSSSHPGGNVTGLPGYNCAQVLHADLGLAGPWRGATSSS